MAFYISPWMNIQGALERVTRATRPHRLFARSDVKARISGAHGVGITGVNLNALWRGR